METNADPEGSETRFSAEYQITDGGIWFVAGDIYGYSEIEDAREALRAQQAKESTTFFGTRVLGITTTCRIVE